MIVQNIILGKNIDIDLSASINNVIIEDDVKIGRNCIFFGSEEQPLKIGRNTYFAIGCLINGFYGAEIGKNVSFGPHVTVLSDSGPNRSEKLQKIYPCSHGKVRIGDDCWIGMNVMIMPGVTLGECCVVAAGSYVTHDFPSFSVIGGVPARLIKNIENEVNRT